MHRNRTWLLDPIELRTQRNRILPIEGGDGSTLSLDFTTGVLDPRLTFTRDGGGTYIGNDGLVYGMDFATSGSLAIGTGSKSVTLTATAGVDRRYLVGQTVWISNGANNMRGPVTAYNASTQALTINATATSGSGSFTSWTVGNASARFDHDPTTLAPRGLLIEGQVATLNQWSEDYTNAYWTKVGSSVGATSVAGPDNVSTATRRIVESATTAQHGIRRGIATTAGQTHTVSVFVKPGSYDSFGFELYWSASYNAKAEVTSISGNTQTVTSASGVNATLTRTVLAASGWYRYALTFTHPLAVGAATPDFNVFVNQTASYAGNGTNYMDVYGFMLEAGSGASSYIPTGASQGTRNSDNLSMTGSGLSWFSNSYSEGTFLFRGSIINTTTGYTRLFALTQSASLGTATGSPNFNVGVAASVSNRPFLNSWVTANNNVDSYVPVGAAVSNGVEFSVAAAYKASDWRISSKNLEATSTFASVGTTWGTNFFMAGINGVYMPAVWFKQLKFFPTRLPNAQMDAWSA